MEDTGVQPSLEMYQSILPYACRDASCNYGIIIQEKIGEQFFFLRKKCMLGSLLFIKRYNADQYVNSHIWRSVKMILWISCSIFIMACMCSIWYLCSDVILDFDLFMQLLYQCIIHLCCLWSTETMKMKVSNGGKEDFLWRLCRNYLIIQKESWNGYYAKNFL